MARYYGTTPFAKNGDKESVPDNKQTNGKLSYETGYTESYELDLEDDPLALNIERKGLNQLLYEITESLGKLQQQGMWDWRSDVSYSRGMQVLYNDDAWLCKNPNSNSAPNSVNTNWIRMVEIFQQVGVSTIISVTNGSVVPAPIKGTKIFITGYWKVSQMRVDYSSRFTVNVNGVTKELLKTGYRGGGSGHSYKSSFFFAFSHIFTTSYNKGDNITISVSTSYVDDYELFLTFIG